LKQFNPDSIDITQVPMMLKLQDEEEENDYAFL
jgi:hypothetical protein